MGPRWQLPAKELGATGVAGPAGDYAASEARSLDADAAGIIVVVIVVAARVGTPARAELCTAVLGE